MSWFRAIEDLSVYDTPCGERAATRDEPSAEHVDVTQFVIESQQRIQAARSHQRFRVINEILDEGPYRGIPSAESRGLTIAPVGPITDSFGGIVTGEWIRSASTDETRRLLYIHGGGFVGGSPLSHRSLTMALAERLHWPVLSIDYRMVPKGKRRQGLADVRAAYDWILEQSPTGSSTAERVVVAGDSAGGNLSLMLLQWARDTGRRPVDAAVTFSPVTDVALGSPSCQRDFERDPVLGDFFKRILRVPRPIRGPLVNMFHGAHRADPMISPVFGALHDLPPTLIQGSESELLRDDANRYANKARAAGSAIEYQTWPGMVHAFPLFEPILPEATEALDRVEEFVARVI